MLSRYSFNDGISALNDSITLKIDLAPLNYKCG